jgi:exopolysaccharide biosynthesis polyprenyl glycosylphosphotransferase
MSGALSEGKDLMTASPPRAVPDGPRRTPLQRRIGQMLLGIFLMDAGVLFVTSCFAWLYQARVDRYWHDTLYPYHWAPVLGPGLILLWLVMLWVFGAYRVRNYGAGFEEFRAIAIASVVALGVAFAFGFLSSHQPTRGYPILFFLFGTPLLLLARWIDRRTLHVARAQGRLSIRMIAMGSPLAVRELVDVLRRSPWMGYKVVGMCLPQGQEEVDIGVPVLGGIDDVRRLAVELGVDGVIVAGGSYSSAADLRRLGWELQGLELDMLVVPALTDIAGPRVHMRHVAGLPFVQVEEPQSDRAGGWAKRTFDIVVAAGVVAALSPLLVVVALLIWLQDRGPVLYRQRRVGANGAQFDMIKFRSMVVDADAKKAELLELNEVGDGMFKLSSDPRVTRVGSLLRRTSLDELPQLFNVLRGEMSLVGPRPLVTDEDARVLGLDRSRLHLTPGMTGPWQVLGARVPMQEMLAIDYLYVASWTLWLDLKVLLRTLRYVIRSANV